MPELSLSFCSVSALDRPIEAVAEMVVALGLDGLEVSGHPPHLPPDASVQLAREVGLAVRRAGSSVTAFGSYLGRFGQVSAADAQRVVAWAEAMQTPLVRVWAEPLPEGNEDMQQAVELMQAACDAARPAAITVVIERHLGSFADTPARIAELFQRIGRDNCALNYQVLDFLPAAQIDAQADDARALIGRAQYFHLKNYQHNPDGHSSLIPGGSLEGGALDYRAILGAALDASYRGPLTIEFLAADERSVEEKLGADAAFVRSVLLGLRA